MGSSGYSGMSAVTSSTYNALRSKRRASSGVDAFTYTHDVRSGKAPAKVHERLDPSKIKDSVTGKRESRDGDIGNSNAVAVFFDVTGSMRLIPVVLQKKLVKLMSTIVTRSVLPNPQILFGAVGDATCDKVPLQIGQFESDLAMDEDIDKIFLEGGGGGQNKESYELAMFFLARLTSIDCYEKRGKKGYAFLIGDETAYPRVKASEVKRIFGIDIGENIPLEVIVQELKEMYEVFFIVPTTASWGNENKHFWIDLFGQNVLEIDNPDLICETIVTAIGMAEGVISSVDDIVADLGLDNNEATSVSNSLSKYTGGKLATAQVTGGSLTPSTDEDDLV